MVVFAHQLIQKAHKVKVIIYRAICIDCKHEWTSRKATEHLAATQSPSAVTLGLKFDLSINGYA